MIDLFKNDNFSEASIEAEIINKLDNYNYIEPQKPDIKVDKFLASSVLQKAIRRGEVKIAISMAQELLSINKKYIWRRLNIIALEDVGAANIGLCNQILWVSGKESWIARHDEHKLLQCLVAQLCESVKDRGGDYLPYIIDYSHLINKERGEYPSMNEEELLDIISDESESIYKRCLASWVLCGDKLIPSENINSRYNNLAAFVGCLKGLNFSEAEIYSIEKGLKKTRCFLPLGMVFSIIESRKSNANNFEVNDLINKSYGGVLLSGLDKHTAIGSRVYKMFLNMSQDPFSQILPNISQEHYYDILGKAIFYLESSKVNKELVIPNLKQIKKDYIISNLGRYGLDDKQVGKILNFVKEGLPLLNEMRQTAIESVISCNELMEIEMAV